MEIKNNDIVLVPKGWQTQHEGGKLVLTYRWFELKFIFMVFVCVLWNSFLVFWYSKIAGLGEDLTITLVFKVLPIVHAIAGLGLTYYTVAGFINKTIITASFGALQIRHTPLPWLYSGSLAVHEIEQLYCKQIAHNNNNGAYYTYRLSAALKNGRERILMSGFEEAEQARYLEKSLEKFLGIADRPVAGEYKG